MLSSPSPLTEAGFADIVRVSLDLMIEVDIREALGSEGVGCESVLTELDLDSSEGCTLDLSTSSALEEAVESELLSLGVRDLGLVTGLKTVPPFWTLENIADGLGTRAHANRLAQ